MSLMALTHLLQGGIIGEFAHDRLMQHNHNLTYSKYAYVIKRAWIIKAVYALGILTWLGVLYGYWEFLNLNIWYWVFIGPLVLLFSLYYFLSFGFNLFYKKFDLKAHHAKMAYFLTKNAAPSVDVFIPTCGEGVHILRQTFKAVSKIEHGGKIQVYVLDDKGREEVNLLAVEFNFNYLSRSNKGYMKKAGNLQFGFENSDSDFILIFDADFAPHPDIVRELLPYMGDKKTAIVQSPQYFETSKSVHKRSALEFGAGHVQEEFYKIIQPSRDRFGGAICVGSNALYRRSALQNVGGMEMIDHSEDIYTGFKLSEKGFKIKYVPLVLAQGLCPEDLHSYFHQQHRWALGNIMLVFSRRFWSAPLNFAQKLCYLNGFLYYLVHALTPIFSFQAFLVLWRHFDYINLKNTLPFLPFIIFSILILPFLKNSLPRYGSLVARMGNSYSFTHAFVTHILKSGVFWSPSRAERKDLSRAFGMFVLGAAVQVVLYAGIISVLVSIGKFPIYGWVYYLVTFWIYYHLFAISALLFHGFKLFDLAKKTAVASGGLHPRHHFGWRLKTVGGFAAIVGLFFGSALYAGVAPKQIEVLAKEPVTKPAAAPLPIYTIETIIPVNPAVTYEVKKGDSWWAISAKFYKSGLYWKKLQDANRENLKIDGDFPLLRNGRPLLIEGSIIVIPKEIRN